MHSFYLACETCHIRQQQGEEFVFQWLDNTTGEIVKELKGKQGSYGARIVPLKDGERLDIFPKKELALEFMKRKDSYTEDERKKIQEELMQHISKEAITCNECHARKGYLNLNALGYNTDRIGQLVQLDIIKLINEYNKFFLPTMFDPRQAGSTKEG